MGVYPKKLRVYLRVYRQGVFRRYPHGSDSSSDQGGKGSGQMQKLGETRQIGGPARIGQILSKVADAMAETIPEIETYMRENESFSETGKLMIAAWNEGLQTSLSA